MYAYVYLTVWPYVGSFKPVSCFCECFVIISAMCIRVCMLPELSGGSKSVEH